MNGHGSSVHTCVHITVYNIFILQVTLYTSCTVLKKRRRHVTINHTTRFHTFSGIFFPQGIVLYISLAKLSMSIASSKNDISTRLLSQRQRKYNITTQQRVLPMCTHTHVRQEQDANTFFLYKYVFYTSLAKAAKFGVPQPEEASHPLTAVNPNLFGGALFIPDVTS